MAGIGNQFTPNSQHMTQILREFMLMLADFGQLLNNPKELQSQIKNAIELSEIEQKKVQDARDYLGQANKIRQEIQARENALKVQTEQNEQRLKRAVELEASNTETSKKLAALAIEQSRKEKIHAEKDNQHAKERSELDAKTTHLEKRSSEIDLKHKTLSDQERSITEKAEKLRRAAEGL